MGGLNHAVKFNAGKATGYTADPEDLKLVTDPMHYLYQERVKLPEDPFLTASMVEFGWIGGAVEVVVNGEEREISKGRQRIKAARAANKIRRKRGLDPIAVPYTLKPKGATEKYLYETGIVENSARVEMGPTSKATEAAELQRRGCQPARIAFLCRIPGNPEKEIPRYLAILDCAPCIREAIESGEVHMGDAPKLAKLSTDAQAEWLAARRAGGVAPGKREKAARSGPAPIRGKHRARALEALEAFAGARGAVQFVRYFDTGDRAHLAGINPEMVRALDAALAPRKPGRKAAA